VFYYLPKPVFFFLWKVFCPPNEINRLLLADCLAACLTWILVRVKTGQRLLWQPRLLSFRRSLLDNGLLCTAVDGRRMLSLMVCCPVTWLFCAAVDGGPAVWLAYSRCFTGRPRCSLSGWLLIFVGLRVKQKLSCWPASCLVSYLAALLMTVRCLVERRYLISSDTLGGASGTSKILPPYVLL
jgi:hypothetical protein